MSAILKDAGSIFDNLVISAIPTHMVEVIWPRVQDMIQVAIDHSNGELDIDQMYTKIVDSEMLLLTINENDRIVATLTIEKRSFDTGKTIMNVVTAGGADMHLWISEVDRVLNQLAKEHGCEDIYIIGRVGWVRTLKEIGYERIHTTLAKRVE